MKAELREQIKSDKDEGERREARWMSEKEENLPLGKPRCRQVVPAV